MAVQATFQAMGLRSEKAVSAHLLLENAYESNFVSDISKVDYLAGSLGRTHLRPLPGLPTFVDDVYVFGYLRREDCVFQGGRLSCSTGEDSPAKHAIARISTAVCECMGTALPAATCRQTSSTQLQPETTPKAAPCERQSPGSSTTPAKRRRQSGESYTRIQNRPASSWQR